MADSHQLRQAFTNMALNACKTIMSYRGGGRLTVETKQGDGVVQVAFAVDHLKLANGRQRGFLDSFLSTRESTGVPGLGLAYGIIKEHEGRMSVHNIPGEGATYVVELPIRKPLPSSVEPPSHALEAVGPRRVLVVDADEKNLDLFEEIVRHLEHRADRGSSAQQALRKIAERDYDLIITDLHLPDMDGLQLYQRLQALRPGLARRVIFISDEPLSGEVCMVLERAGCPLIRKPFSVADIETAMRQVLRM
jgi:CheY-like chemotaxis protein